MSSLCVFISLLLTIIGCYLLWLFIIHSKDKSSIKPNLFFILFALIFSVCILIGAPVGLLLYFNII